MREIKFRAWNKAKKKMYPPWSIFKTYFGDMDTFDLVVMQFTGLKDKNGKEIYEGDVVQKWHYNKQEYTAIVKHIDFIDSLMDDYRGKSVSGFYLTNNEWEYPKDEFYNLEVIGNIYENPELKEAK